MLKRFLLLLAAVAIAVTLTPAPSVQALPTMKSQTIGYSGDAKVIAWGSCGVISKEKKLVRTYSRRGGAKVYLYCGGPKFSSDPTWGYRHILKRHRDDFERKAFRTRQTWRELADISIEVALAHPKVAGPIRSGKRCYSAVVYLIDHRNGDVVGTMIVRVLWRISDNAIITAYPAARHC